MKTDVNLLNRKHYKHGKVRSVPENFQSQGVNGEF